MTKLCKYLWHKNQIWLEAKNSSVLKNMISLGYVSVFISNNVKIYFLKCIGNSLNNFIESSFKLYIL